YSVFYKRYCLRSYCPNINGINFLLPTIMYSLLAEEWIYARTEKLRQTVFAAHFNNRQKNNQINASLSFWAVSVKRKQGNFQTPTDKSSCRTF
ncbi:MAG: hypothetical protein ACLSE6_08260, partial [Alphaproteobacteria bacterium]